MISTQLCHVADSAAAPLVREYGNKVKVKKEFDLASEYGSWII